MTMRLLLAFDPGDTTGWAVLNFDNGDLIQYSQVPADEVPDSLAGWSVIIDTLNIVKIVCEEYRILPHKANQHIGSQVQATRVIGMIKQWAAQHDIPVIMQPPEHKNTGAKVSGMKPPSNHKLSHWVDAYNHGYFFLNKIGKAKHRRDK